jgi:hypothetical protein
VVAEGSLPGAPGDKPGGGKTVAAPLVSAVAKSGKVKRGKFTSTLTIALKPSSAATSCGGRLGMTLRSSVKKSKPIKKAVALKLKGGSCVAVLKVKLTAKLKGKKASLQLAHSGAEGFAATAQKLALKRL